MHMVNPMQTNTMHSNTVMSQQQQQQGGAVHMGTIHNGPPPSAIQVYTHQQPIVGHAIPMSNSGPSGYSQVSQANPPTKDHFY
jgi:hypothetical protein